MKHVQIPHQDILVSLIFTESAASILNLNVPHLDQLHPEDSNICLVSPSNYDCFQLEVKNGYGSYNTSPNKTIIKEEKDEVFLQISSDIALFSVLSNSSSQSDVNSDRESDDSIISKIQDKTSKIFQAIKVHHLPLASARSTAHSNKLEAQSNKLYVSLLETNSSSEFLCRICHGGESFEDLLKPCRCRGTVALVHLKCLERWLRESNHSTCELCQHHYKTIREPLYSIPKSIYYYLRHPGDNLREILLDLIAFALYTPSTVASSYMLIMMCEHFIKSKTIVTGSFSSHVIAFSTILGMAAIDFTYASWLMLTMQKHVENWREWYYANSKFKVVLPAIKLRPHKMKRRTIRLEK